jgi:type I restriction enzyme M protein
VTRGSSLNKAKLDEIHSDTPTGFRYLMLQDIEDGEIAQDLPNISGIERSQLKYCVHDGDVVLSKIVSGANFKVAIAHVAPGEKLLATGNLYIIRPDKSKLLPEYLMRKVPQW